MRVHQLSCTAVAVVLLSLVPRSDLAARRDLSRQERLFVVGWGATDNLLEIDTSPEGFGTIRTSARATVPFTTLIALAGGRYIISPYNDSTSSRWPWTLSVLDTKTGAMSSLDVSGPLLTVDTHRPRVFLIDGDSVAVVDVPSGTKRLLPVEGADRGFGLVLPTPAAYAGGSDRLFVARPGKPVARPANIGIVDVVDVASATVVRSIVTGSRLSATAALTTDSSGARLFVVDGYLAAFDTTTGALIKAVPVPAPFHGNFDYRVELLRLDEPRRRLWWRNLSFNPFTLERTGEIPSLGGPTFTLFGPRSPLVTFSARASGGGYFGGPSGCLTAPLERRDPDSGALERSVDLRLYFGDNNYPQCFIRLVMTTVPPPPRALTADVRRRQVTLSWIDPGNSTHFDIEAGAAPGLGNLLRRSVTGTKWTEHDVQPGTYYVRARAINDVGRSLPTDDIMIAVR